MWEVFRDELVPVCDVADESIDVYNSYDDPATEEEEDTEDEDTLF